MTESLAKKVIAKLEAGETVDFELPRGGRLHIDRPLPFLCVYRPQTPGSEADTESLLMTQSAWLIVAPQVDISDWLGELMQYLQQRFGACLLLELWTGQAVAEALPPHAFNIVADPDHDLPELLEQLENALLQVTIHRKTPQISLQYRKPVAPAGLPPLLPEGHCHVVGLEINPVYRDPQSGDTFVFAHRAFRQRLNRALKRTFYHFSHHQTHHRPAHFHALGPQSVEDDVRRVDAALARISDSFDLLLHVTPINAEAAWQAFSSSDFERPAELRYRPRTIDPDLMKRELFGIEIEAIDDPTMADIFSAKRNELDRQITLVADRNTPRFLLGSRQLFGDPDDSLLAVARKILRKIPPPDSASAKVMLDAWQFARRAESELARYREQDATLTARVEVRDDIAGIMVSHGNFLIGSAATVSEDRVDAALAHEIGTHALTWHNGRQQPLAELRCGMADYEPLQEGLAVLAEYLVGGLDPGRLRQLAGRVIAVKLITDGADFVETFRLLHDSEGFSAKAAFMMTLRVFRGGGYTKDAIYLRGLMDLLDYLGQGNDLHALWLGKLSMSHLPLIKELRWRKILKPPALLPHLFARPEVTPRLERLEQGMQVMDLLEGKH